MSNPVTVRPETEADREAVREVHRLAFGQADEARLVDALRDGGHARVSLVAETDGRVVGHILFSELPILAETGTRAALSLAPLAVLPAYQARGIGSTLTRAALEACRVAGHRIVVVLGHAHYYPRFGFTAKLAESLSSPFYARDSWMALELEPGALDGVAGWVQYPAPFGVGPFVRPAHATDRAEWLRMRKALWPDDGDDAHAAEMASYFGAGSFRPAGSVPALAVFVVVRPDTRLCGFVEVSVRPYAEDCRPGPVGYVEGWYVDPDMRQQWFGRRLIEAAEQWAAAQGCAEMASDAVLDNAVSHAAHKALGYEESSRLVHFRKRLPPWQEACDPVSHRLRLLKVDGTFAVCKLPTDAPLPPWATQGDIFSVTRTAAELSVVCRQEMVPEGVTREPDWRCLRVAGAMPFTAVGVLASLTTPLAAAGVSVFALSTFDTDYLLVKAADMDKSLTVLRAAGHVVETEV